MTDAALTERRAARTLVMSLVILPLLTAPLPAEETSPKTNPAGQSGEIPVLKGGDGQTQWFGQDPRWYAGDEAMLIADSVICFQRESGGWSKARFAILNDNQKAMLRENPKLTTVPWAEHIDVRIPTLDNGSTFTQMKYLALVHNARVAGGGKDEDTGRVRESFLKGLDYILDLQFDCGGWPQQSRREDGSFWSYTGNITFNDHVTVYALTMLQDVVDGKFASAPDADLGFVDQERRQRAAAAVKRGIDCILKCQIIVDGNPTVWSQQHDPVTFRPRGGRPFEPPALCGGMESVNIIRFLMRSENPTPEMIEAVQNAVAWYDQAKIMGRMVVKRFSEKPGRTHDVCIGEIPGAPPQWGRYHYSGDLGEWAPHVTFDGLKVNQPIFVDHDRKIYATVASLSYGRRIGYNWMDGYANDLLTKEYPAWQERHAPRKDMRKDPIWKKLEN